MTEQEISDLLEMQSRYRLHHGRYTQARVSVLIVGALSLGLLIYIAFSDTHDSRMVLALLGLCAGVVAMGSLALSEKNKAARVGEINPAMWEKAVAKANEEMRKRDRAAAKLREQGEDRKKK